MTVKQLIKELKKCRPDLEVEMFAHDQQPSHIDEGDGKVRFVGEVIRDDGVTIVALQS
jgi:hypothetical protein